MHHSSESAQQPGQLRLFPVCGPHGAAAARAGLGWCLAVTGEDRLEVWAPLVVEAVRDRFAGNERTAAKAAADAARLLRYLGACGAQRWGDVIAEMVNGWCWAARVDRSGRWRRAAPSTARNRQWVATAVFEEAARLGASVDAATAVGERIARPSGLVSARPLTVEEADLVRVFADAGLVASRRSLLVAFSFAGGTASEVAAVRACDLNLEAATVAFRGNVARTGNLDGWCSETVRRFARNSGPLDHDELLCVTAATLPSRAAHSVTVRLGQVLRDAGIAGRPGVTARSIRLTTARAVLDSDGIEAASRFLGSPSLDSTASALGYDWRAGGL